MSEDQAPQERPPMQLDGEDHVVGDAECQAGWCGGLSYPKPCDLTPGCTGLVHAAFGDQVSYDSYYLYTRCDVCEESE